MRYGTVVADPPWRYDLTLPSWGEAGAVRSAVSYPTMTIEQIRALPVSDLAADAAHLYLWTTNTHLEHAWAVVEAWGFTYSTLLVWCKAPRGGGGFPAYAVSTEYVLFCRQGSARSPIQVGRNWWEWPRGRHSEKPEAFYDIVEQVSPGPRLEMFARRNRLGWHTWGNECLPHVAEEALCHRLP